MAARRKLDRLESGGMTRLCASSSANRRPAASTFSQQYVGNPTPRRH